MYRITAVNRNFTLKTSLNSIWRGTLQDNIQASIRYPTKPVIMSLNGLIATLPTLFPPNDSSSTGRIDGFHIRLSLERAITRYDPSGGRF